MLSAAPANIKTDVSSIEPYCHGHKSAIAAASRWNRWTISSSCDGDNFDMVAMVGAIQKEQKDT
jgi:hypothetical protein